MAANIHCNLVNQVDQVNRVGPEDITALLHLVEVQRQIHHAQDAVARTLDDAQQLVGLRREAPLFAQQARHGNDAVERRLDVVACNALHLFAQLHVFHQRLVLQLKLPGLRGNLVVRGMQRLLLGAAFGDVCE